jgi:hypothetical protein
LILEFFFVFDSHLNHPAAATETAQNQRLKGRLRDGTLLKPGAEALWSDLQLLVQASCSTLSN